MTLTADEFTRRFLMHVLPRGFTRIRYFGYLANRHRREKLAAARQLLRRDAPSLPAEPSPPPAAPAASAASANDKGAVIRCSVCCAGRMQKLAALPPYAPSNLQWLLRRGPNVLRPLRTDTS